MKDDPTPRIAARLRELRRQRDWSLEEFASRAGVSKAMLSRIERGEASPTAMLLGRISGALEMSLSTLLADHDGVATRLVRAADQPTWRDPASGYLRRQVSPLSEIPVQLVEVSLPAGARVPYPAAAYAFNRHLLWLLEGTLALSEGGLLHQLRAGDCLEFGEPADCVYHNPGRRPCRYLVTVIRR